MQGYQTRDAPIPTTESDTAAGRQASATSPASTQDNTSDVRGSEIAFNIHENDRRRQTGKHVPPKYQEEAKAILMQRQQRNYQS